MLNFDNLEKIVCLDIESSSLFDGFPVEIGWAFVDSPKTRFQSILINPYTQDNWADRPHRWDPMAQEVHGLSLSYLGKNGIPANHAVRRIEAALKGCTVLVDSPLDWEWLQVAYDDVGIKLDDCSFQRESWNRVFDDTPAHLLTQFREAADLAYPKRHRAVPDAQRNAEVIRLMFEWIRMPAPQASVEGHGLF